MPLNGNWNYPTAIRFGAGRVRELGEACRQAGISKPLLVTDPSLAALPMVEDAIKAVEGAGLAVKVFSAIKGNPTLENVEAGVAAFRTGGHDGVVAFGGGSALDAGKAIAFQAGQTRRLWDFEDVGDNWTRADPAGIAPNVCVATTSGTGSDVGRAAVITDAARHVKKVIFHPRMMPSVTVADPALTVGLPPHVTAATGMDALSHNLEAYLAPFYHPFAKGVALEGMRLVKDWLPTAVRDGGNIAARSHMMAAAMAGATAFQRGLGGIHALAHPLGALYDAHHGLLNAVLMPYVVNANKGAVERDLTDLARALDLAEYSPAGVIRWILDLRAEIGIPHTLAEIGIPGDDAATVGAMAVEDPTAGGNPIQFTQDQYAALFLDAHGGRLEF
ncbi:MAG: alcohol dehydrogenase [Rhodospirillales bacterium CG15_BIG_FIL_POST_REV_8_21_14_020_66_15]|nr:MAG: alcohol dehydrogenase [Rhodospirillales bacterium CG15_BIG_FIL_POST_REV_8_21_14_020_66_15]